PCSGRPGAHCGPIPGSGWLRDTPRQSISSSPCGNDNSARRLVGRARSPPAFPQIHATGPEAPVSSAAGSKAQLGTEKYPALTGVRALGASVVFFDHYSPWPDSHIIINVLAFFYVLSGFLITRIYYEQVQLQRAWLWKYFVNRFARIYPIYFLILSVVVLLGQHADPLTLVRNYTLTHALFHGTPLLIPPPGLPAAGAPPRAGVVIRFGLRARRGGAGHLPSPVRAAAHANVRPDDHVLRALCRVLRRSLVGALGSAAREGRGGHEGTLAYRRRGSGRGAAHPRHGLRLPPSATECICHPLDQQCVDSGADRSAVPGTDPREHSGVENSVGPGRRADGSRFLLFLPAARADHRLCQHPHCRCHERAPAVCRGDIRGHVAGRGRPVPPVRGASQSPHPWAIQIEGPRGRHVGYVISPGARGCPLRAGSAVSASAQDDHKMIAERAHDGPGGKPLVDSPQRPIHLWISFVEPGQIGRRRKDAQSANLTHGELARERAPELPRPVVVRPDSVPVHADRRESSREPHFGPSPAAAYAVVQEFPRAQPADHRKDEGAAGLDQARALSRHPRQVRHAIQRAQIGVRSVVDPIALEALELVTPDHHRSNAVAELLALSPLSRPLHHAGRPVDRRHVMTETGHADCIEARATADIDEAAGGAERRIEPVPHPGAHSLNQR